MKQEKILLVNQVIVRTVIKLFKYKHSANINYANFA